MTNISPELLQIGFCNLVQMLFYVKENQTPSTYSTLNFFIFLSPILKYQEIPSLFSWGMRPTKLKLGLHMDSRYHVYLNQAAGAYLFLYFFSFLSLIWNSKTLNFCHTFLSGLQSWNLIHTWAIVDLLCICCQIYKVETWYTHGQ